MTPEAKKKLKWGVGIAFVIIIILAIVVIFVFILYYTMSSFTSSHFSSLVDGVNAKIL